MLVNVRKRIHSCLYRLVSVYLGFRSGDAGKKPTLCALEIFLLWLGFTVGGLGFKV